MGILTNDIRCRLSLSFMFLTMALLAHGQQQTAAADSLHRGRLRLLVGGGSIAYAGVLVSLYHVWYQDTEITGFRFYDDTRDWLQIDKFGHAYTAYQQGVLGYRALRWAGVPDKKAILFGGGLGVFMQTPIEILDGLSDEWGASPTDLLANTAGTLLFVGQQLHWGEQRIRMKYALYPSKYSRRHAPRFGNSLWEKLVQDYNGHTYWLSASPGTFLTESKFPDWLCLSLGYGIDGVMDERSNPTTYRGEVLPDYRRQRQFYLSLDIDLTKIKTRSRFLRTLFLGINSLKIPAPTLELNQHGGLRFYPLFF